MSTVQVFGAQSVGGTGLAKTSERLRVSFLRTWNIFVEMVVYPTVGSQTGYEKGGK